MRLISEEFQEMASAAENINSLWADCPEEERLILAQDFLKEITDCVYVLAGTPEIFGWNFERAFNKVHASNMTKLQFKVERGDDGKIKKSSTYKPPNLEDCVDV